MSFMVRDVTVSMTLERSCLPDRKLFEFQHHRRRATHLQPSLGLFRSAGTRRIRTSDLFFDLPTFAAAFCSFSSNLFALFSTRFFCVLLFFRLAVLVHGEFIFAGSLGDRQHIVPSLKSLEGPSSPQGTRLKRMKRCSIWALILSKMLAATYLTRACKVQSFEFGGPQLST